jgi:transposase-like protein
MSRSLLSREDRAGVLALRRREGLSFRELSAATGIRDATLRMWARRERVSRRRAEFVEVKVPVPSAGQALELVVGDRVVRLPAGFDAAELRRLLAVLEQTC